MAEKRAVCLNCIDGRVQLPVLKWLRDNHGFAHTDMITEPGMDLFLSDENNPIDDIIKKINISIEKNNASGIFVVGHHDCRANPVSESDHKKHILSAVSRLKKIFPGPDVTGLWVNSQWRVESL